MKTKILFTAVCILLLTNFGGALAAGKNERSRSVEKVFKVSRGTDLQVAHSFGGLTIVVWDRNEIKFNAEITVWGGNPTDVERALDDITFEFKESPRFVSARTVVERADNRRPSRRNISREINVTVHVPNHVVMDLKTTFGGIYSQNIKTNFTASATHGGITVKDLEGAENRLSSQFGAIKVGNARKLEVRTSHGGFTGGKMGEIDVKSQHGPVALDMAEKATVSVSHGNFTIHQVGKLELSVQFGQARIGSVGSSIIADKISHGGLKVGLVKSGFDRVDVKSSFSNVIVSIDPAANFRFDITNNMGVIRFSDFPMINTIIDNKSMTHSYKGMTSEEASSSVQISGTHGSIAISKP